MLSQKYKNGGKLEVVAEAGVGGGVGTWVIVGIGDKVEFNALDDWLYVAESTTLQVCRHRECSLFHRLKEPDYKLPPRRLARGKKNHHLR